MAFVGNVGVKGRCDQRSYGISSRGRRNVSFHRGVATMNIAPQPEPEVLMRTMASAWSNKQQAFENPPFWAHINVFLRPIPAGILDEPALMYESFYDYSPTKPYISKLLTFFKRDGKVCSRAHTVSDESFKGASKNPEKLAELKKELLIPVPEACIQYFEYNGRKKTWRGYICPGNKCISNFKDKVTYLDGNYTVSEDRFTSWDVGRDLETHDILWGALAGPFDFRKVEDYSKEVPMQVKAESPASAEVGATES